jgi:tetratricopeptide (TPR) repeat protein
MIEERNGSARTAVNEVRSLLRTNRPAEAAALLRALLAVRMGTAEDYMLFGIALAQTGATSAALEALEQAVVIDPRDPVAHFNLGQVYRQAGRDRQALRAFDRACSLRPDYRVAITAAAEMRGRDAPLGLGLSGQPPTQAWPGVAAPTPIRTERLTAPPPATEWNPGGWDHAPILSAAEVEREPVPRPRCLTVLLILTYIGATMGLITGLITILAGGLLGSVGPRALGLGPMPSSGTVIGLGVFALVESAARLGVGCVLWQGYRWARVAMMGVLGMGMVLPLVTLFHAADLYAEAKGFGGLLFPILFIAVLNLDSVKEYCTR